MTARLSLSFPRFSRFRFLFLLIRSFLLTTRHCGEEGQKGKGGGKQENVDPLCDNDDSYTRAAASSRRRQQMQWKRKSIRHVYTKVDKRKWKEISTNGMSPLRSYYWIFFIFYFFWRVERINCWKRVLFVSGFFSLSTHKIRSTEFECKIGIPPFSFLCVCVCVLRLEEIISHLAFEWWTRTRRQFCPISSYFLFFSKHIRVDSLA